MMKWIAPALGVIALAVFASLNWYVWIWMALTSGRTQHGYDVQYVAVSILAGGIVTAALMLWVPVLQKIWRKHLEDH